MSSGSSFIQELAKVENFIQIVNSVVQNHTKQSESARVASTSEMVFLRKTPRNKIRARIGPHNYRGHDLMRKYPFSCIFMNMSPACYKGKSHVIDATRHCVVVVLAATASPLRPRRCAVTAGEPSPRRSWRTNLCTADTIWRRRIMVCLRRPPFPVLLPVAGFS